MEIDSRDYHDYVFKDGGLLGEFEQMYRKSKNAPWHQDRIKEEFDVTIIKSFTHSRAPYATILDVGCGLGYFANELTHFSERLYGIDVSKTAVQKMGKIFPQILGQVVDITRERGRENYSQM